MGQAICNTSRRAYINGNNNPQPFDRILLLDIVLEQQLCILYNVDDSVLAQASSESEDSLVGDIPLHWPVDDTQRCAATYRCHLPIS
jgi:hypothetical protein